MSHKLKKVIEDYLADWDKDASFGKQVDDLVSQIVEATPKRAIPDCAVCFFKDGDKWCCVFGDFVDLQQSDAGFGSDFTEALADLERVRSKA